MELFAKYLNNQDMLGFEPKPPEDELELQNGASDGAKPAVLKM